MANRNEYQYTPGYTGNGRGYPTGNGRQMPQQGAYRPPQQGQRPAAMPRQQGAPMSGRYIPPQQRRDLPPPMPSTGMPVTPVQPPVQGGEMGRPKIELILFAVILFGIPLIGFIGLFVQPFLWILAAVSLISLAVVLVTRSFAQRIRIIICAVLLILAILGVVAANEMAPKQGNYPVYGNNPSSLADNTDPYAVDTGSQLNNPAYVGFTGVSATPTAPIGGEADYTDPNQVADGTNDTGLGDMGAVQMGYENEAPLNHALTGAQTALNNYLEQWKNRDWEEMVNYVTPSWRGAQQAPQQQIYWNHSWWILNSWTISAQNTTSPSADSATFRVITDLSKSNSTKTPAKMEYTAIVFQEGNGWYVDPDSMRNGIAIVESEGGDTSGDGQTADPNAGQQSGDTGSSVPNDTKLYYNEQGGKYYHAEEHCKSIGTDYYKYMKGFTYGELSGDSYSKLLPCPQCSAPKKQQ